LARLAYLFFAEQRVPHADDLFYWETANSLATSGEFTFQGEPATQWMPGLPLLLSLVVRVFGASYLPARLFLLGLSLLAVPLVAGLARRWFGPREEKISAWAVALFPPFWFYATALLSETPALLLAGGALACASRLREGFLWRFSLGLGLCYGGLMYLKPEFSFLGPLYVAVSWLRPKSLSRRGAALALVLGLSTLAPWTYRNWTVFHEFIPLKSTGGQLLWWASYHPPILEGHPYSAEGEAELEKIIVPGKPGETSQNYSRLGLARIKADPLPYLVECVTVRAKSLFFGSQGEATVALSRSFAQLRSAGEHPLLAVKLSLFAGQALLSLLGIAGLFLPDPERKRSVAFWHFLGNVGIYAALFGITRYSMVLMPILIPHASALGLRLSLRLRARRAPSA
jgi:hypothetical protein